MAKRIFILSLGVFIIILLFSFIPSLLLPKQNTPPPPTTSFDKDYSSLNKTVPGKSTISDVEKINGEALSKEDKDEKVYLYYPTPSSDFKNVVVFKNGVEQYALENIFSDYRGNYESFAKAYGGPGLTLYDNGPSYFSWQVFLNSGVGVKTNGKDILQIIYFVPQEKNSFVQSVGLALGLSEQKPAAVY